MTVNKQEGNVAGSRIQPAIPIAGVFSNSSCLMQYGVITPPLHLSHVGSRMPRLLQPRLSCPFPTY